jgi:uncharacterized protein DUF3761
MGARFQIEETGERGRVGSLAEVKTRRTAVAVFAALMLVALSAWVSPTYADGKDAPTAPDVQITQPKSKQPNEADLQEHGHYVNKQGDTVHSPAHSKSGAVPDGATAQCRDGSYSFSQHRSGTCSHHGGVGKWLN